MGIAYGRAGRYVVSHLKLHNQEHFIYNQVNLQSDLEMFRQQQVPETYLKYGVGGITLSSCTYVQRVVNRL